MVLLDGDVSPRAARAAGSDGEDHPLAGLGQLRHQIEHLASWTTAVTRGMPEQADPPFVQVCEPPRTGMFGWRLKRH